MSTEVKSRRPRAFPTDGLLLEGYARGFARIAGVDEVGRGPLAGPVVAAAVILPAGFSHPELNDSKKMVPLKRCRLAEELQTTTGLLWSIGQASVEEIDQYNILQAALLAMRRAVEGLKSKPDYLHIDGNKGIGCGLPERTIVGGDGKCTAIAAASVIAKEFRDELMNKLAEEYPQYGFEQHKGYGTAQHMKTLEQYGPCTIHRRSFLRNWTASRAGV